MFNHSFKGVQDSRRFPPIPEGEYDLTITDTKEKTTKDGAHPMVAVTFEVVGGEYDGRKVFHNVTFFAPDHKAAGIAKHFLKAIDQPFEDEVKVKPEEWKGAGIKARISIREYNGKFSNEIIDIIAEEKDEKEIPF